MKISVVTTLYCSAGFLEKFYERMTSVLKETADESEIIFVHDGSPDNSLDIAVSLQANDQKVKVIDLSRNFGHHKAIMTGLRHASGELVFLIDCDLEEDPGLLRVYLRKYREDQKCDVVYGIQKNRKGKWFEKISGDLFYRMINFLSGENMPRNVSLSRLMSNRYVKDLISFQDQEPYLPGLWHFTGYRQVSIPIEKKCNGVSTYTLQKKIALSINAITSFSEKPLVYIFYTGLLISFLSLTYAAFCFAAWFFWERPITGWSSLIVSIWIIGGLVIFFLGVIGIYLSRIFVESKKRPYTIVKKIYQ